MPVRPALLLVRVPLLLVVQPLGVFPAPVGVFHAVLELVLRLVGLGVVDGLTGDVILVARLRQGPVVFDLHRVALDRERLLVLLGFALSYIGLLFDGILGGMTLRLARALVGGFGLVHGIFSNVFKDLVLCLSVS
jgi:hypothetical protein